MNMIVSSASGKLAVRSDRVETDIWKYKKYTLVMDASNNMAWHIDGSYIKGIDTDRVAIVPTETAVFDNRELLDSLIALSSDIVDYSKREKKILKWLEKYGLPFVDVEASQAEHAFVCPLGPFMEFLWELRDVILKIEAINNTGISISGKPNTNLNPYINGNLVWQESSIEDLICEWLNDASISIKTKFENHEPTLFLASNSVLDTGKYQLALLLLSNEGISPRRCACCNSHFIPRRENQKYCSFCSPQKRYAQRTRALAKKNGRYQDNG